MTQPPAGAGSPPICPNGQPLLSSADVCSLVVHAGNGPYRSLTLTDTAWWETLCVPPLARSCVTPARRSPCRGQASAQRSGRRGDGSSRTRATEVQGEEPWGDARRRRLPKNLSKAAVATTAKTCSVVELARFLRTHSCV